MTESKNLEDLVGMLEDFVNVPMAKDTVNLTVQTKKTRQNLVIMKQIFKIFGYVTKENLHPCWGMRNYGGELNFKKIRLFCR